MILILVQLMHIDMAFLNVLGVSVRHSITATKASKIDKSGSITHTLLLSFQELSGEILGCMRRVGSMKHFRGSEVGEDDPCLVQPLYCVGQLDGTWKYIQAL
jgi:hypothetical protein